MDFAKGLKFSNVQAQLIVEKNTLIERFNLTFFSNYKVNPIGGKIIFIVDTPCKSNFVEAKVSTECRHRVERIDGQITLIVNFGEVCACTPINIQVDLIFCSRCPYTCVESAYEIDGYSNGDISSTFTGILNYIPTECCNGNCYENGYETNNGDCCANGWVDNGTKSKWGANCDCKPF